MNREAPRKQDLEALDDAVMLAVPPRPGYRCKGWLVTTMWVELTDEDRVDINYLAKSPEETRFILGAIRRFADDMDL